MDRNGENDEYVDNLEPLEDDEDTIINNEDDEVIEIP